MQTVFRATPGGTMASPGMTTHHMITRSSPSPWSKFLSPSLFANTPGTNVAPGANQASQQPSRQLSIQPIAVAPQLAGPGFTHEREINPFEKSFAPMGSTTSTTSTSTASPSATRRLNNKRSTSLLDLSSMRPTSTKSAGAPPVLEPSSRIRFADSSAGSSSSSTKTMTTTTPVVTRPKLRLGLAARRMNAKSQQAIASSGENSAARTSSSSSEEIGGSALNSFTSSNSSGSSGNTSDRSSKEQTDSPASSIAPSPGLSDDAGKSTAAASSAPTQASASDDGPLARLVSAVPSAATGGAFHHYQPAPLPMSYPSSTVWQQHSSIIPAPHPTQAIRASAPSVAAVPVASTSYLEGAQEGDQYNHDYSTMTAGDLDASYRSFEFSVPTSTLAPTAFSASMLGPHESVGVASSIASSTNSPAATTNALPAPRKRGRKPKTALPEENTEAVKLEALERNRIAASKSRRRKKERVSGLEQNAAELAHSNQRLQHMCHELQAELAQLRSILSQIHPVDCDCVHVRGYCAREAAGGGIPTIERIAGRTLAIDYSKVPRWGSEDDCYCAPAQAGGRTKRPAPVDVDMNGDRSAIPIKRVR